MPIPDGWSICHSYMGILHSTLSWSAEIVGNLRISNAGDIYALTISPNFSFLWSYISVFQIEIPSSALGYTLFPSATGA